MRVANDHATIRASVSCQIPLGSLDNHNENPDVGHGSQDCETWDVERSVNRTVK